MSPGYDSRHRRWSAGPRTPLRRAARGLLSNAGVFVSPPAQRGANTNLGDYEAAGGGTPAVASTPGPGKADDAGRRCYGTIPDGRVTSPPLLLPDRHPSARGRRYRSRPGPPKGRPNGHRKSRQPPVAPAALLHPEEATKSRGSRLRGPFAETRPPWRARRPSTLIRWHAARTSPTRVIRVP